uniref:Uncharacterized protein n=1 Tax=Arundo donax TaxID=35708 RepID=A0A0A9GF53_ARUDO
MALVLQLDWGERGRLAMRVTDWSSSNGEFRRGGGLVDLCVALLFGFGEQLNNEEVDRSAVWVWCLSVWKGSKVVDLVVAEEERGGAGGLA